jgi:hypothetical protein
LIANDDSRVVEVLAVTGTAPLIERVDFVAGVAGMPITLSHALAATDKVVDVKADPNLATIAYMVRTTNTIPFELYFADVATPVTGQLVGSIQSDSVNPPPTIDAVRKNGDAALVHTLQLVSVGPPATYNEILREIDLSTAAISRPIQTRPQGLNVYTYVDDFTSVAFTTNTGVSVAPRSNLAQQQVIFSAAAAFFEFSADNQLLAAITAPTALPPLSLFLVNRGTGALQLTGLSNDPTVRTLSIRLVPGTTTN